MSLKKRLIEDVNEKAFGIMERKLTELGVGGYSTGVAGASKPAPKTADEKRKEEMSGGAPAGTTGGTTSANAGAYVVPLGATPAGQNADKKKKRKQVLAAEGYGGKAGRALAQFDDLKKQGRVVAPFKKKTEGGTHFRDNSQRKEEVGSPTLATEPKKDAKYRAYDQVQKAGFVTEPGNKKKVYKETITHKELRRHLRETDGHGHFESAFILPFKFKAYELKKVPLEMIKDVSGMKVTADDKEMVEAYAESSGDFPPVVAGDVNLGMDGKLEITLMDGCHRVEAAQRRGDKEILAYVPRKKKLKEFWGA